MDRQQFDKVSRDLAMLADNIATLKRPGYTQGHSDVLINFKEGAALARIHPLQNWAAHVHKQLAAIISFVTNPESSKGGEPIVTRFADLLNYVYLGHALFQDARRPDSIETLPGSKLAYDPATPTDEPVFLRKMMD